MRFCIDDSRFFQAWYVAWRNISVSHTFVQVEHILREEATMAAYDVIELFCELLCVRLPIIEANK